MSLGAIPLVAATAGRDFSGLVAVWLGLGFLAGALAHAGRLGFAARLPSSRWGGIRTLALGLALGLLGGVLGAWAFGVGFGAPEALALSALGVVVIPWLAARRATRTQPPKQQAFPATASSRPPQAHDETVTKG